MMGGKSGANGTSKSNLALKRQVELLETENSRLLAEKEVLERKVNDLTRINNTQLQRLIEQELLQIRVRELEARVKAQPEEVK